MSVTATVTDGAGNTTMCPLTFNIIIDDNITCSLTDTLVILDADGNATINPDDVVDVTGGSCGTNVNVTISQTTFDCDDVGTVDVTIFANGAECGTGTFTVVDNIAPELTCSADITVNTGDGDTSNGSDCAYTVPDMSLDPLATDNCDIATITNSVNNGSSLEGETFDVMNSPHTVVWTVTDENGNSSTCEYIITVEDDEAPVCGATTMFDVTLSANQVYVIADSNIDFGFTDNCGVANVTFDPPTLECTDDSPVDVNATVTDGAGNTTTCPLVFNIIVDDAVTCVIVPDTLFLDEFGNIDIDASLTSVTGGNCGDMPTITVSPSFLSCNNKSMPPIITIFVDGVACGTDSVVVADTIPPMVFCSDATITCLDFESLFNSSVTQVLDDINAFDSITDNCLAQTMNNLMMTIDTSGLNSCGYGVITRTTIAMDIFNGDADTCVQTITIEGPQNPLTQADVDGILMDTVIVNDCIGADIITDTITLDDINALVDCGEFTIDFMDVSLNPGGCPDTIIRTYTIDAICQDEVLTSVQTIIVFDNIAPMIANIDSQTVVVNPEFCSAFFNPNGLINVTDNCDDPITVTYSIDGGASMPVDQQVGLDAGDYTVFVDAVDACGNMSQFDFPLALIDTSALTIECVKIVVPLDSITGEVILNGLDPAIISGNCDSSAVIIGSFAPSFMGTVDPSNTDILVTCDDLPSIPFDSLVFISFFEVINGDTLPFSGDVLNIPGNTCRALITFTDPGNACGNTIFGIAGEVTTPQGEGIPDYTLMLNGSNIDPVTSDDEGEYAFPRMQGGGPYEIATFNNDDILNGVTTLDLIMIQRHILGLDLFDSPYDYIAADIDNNERVSSSDLLELRKVILGIYAEFPNNYSWRAIDATYIFPDPNDPFDASIPETYTINPLEQDMDVDFVGVKVGDVNGSVSVGVKGSNPIAQIRNTTATVLETSTRNNIVSISTQEHLDIAGVQMTVNTNGHEILAVDSEVFGSEAISLRNIGNGIYSLIITDGIVKEVADTQELITLTLSCESCSEDVLSLMSVGLSSELYLGDDLEISDIVLERRSTEINDFYVYQNNPNPWYGTTEVAIRMPQDGEVEMSVLDMSGRVVYNNKYLMSAGLNTILLTDQEVSSQGVYYIDIRTENDSQQFKMLKLK